jgi:hypothetical protein
LLENSLFWPKIWKYGQWPHLLRVPFEIKGYNFKIYDKFKKLTLVPICRFIHYISMIWFFRISSAKRSLYVSNLQVSFVFMYILLEDMLMCLINVINNFHCLWYIHTARQMKIQPQKIKTNLSAKRSTLKPYNFKISPMTPDFLYNFLTILQSRN